MYSLQLINLLSIIRSALWALHPNKVHLDLALFVAVIAQYVRIQIFIFVWHRLTLDQVIVKGLISSWVNKGLAANRAAKVRFLIGIQTLNVHGVPTPK
jgi:hypothetical protein